MQHHATWYTLEQSYDKAKIGFVFLMNKNADKIVAHLI